jgi:hypothetical protein
MYGVVRSYTGASELFDVLEREHEAVKSVIRGIPGVIAYYLIRSEDGGASVTICENQQAADETTKAAAAWTRENAAAVVGDPPTLTAGNVIIQV